MNNFSQKNKTKILDIKLLILALIKNKIYLGLDKTVCHPNASGYLKGFRNKTYIFDLYKTAQNFQTALKIIYKIHSVHLEVTKRYRLKIKPKKKILFIGFPEMDYERKMLKNLYYSKNHFYASDKYWVKGLLTNNFSLFEYKRDFLKNIHEKTADEKKVFYQNFGGVLKMSTLPDLVVIYNHSLSSTAFNEAKRMNIPVISFLNASDDPSEVDYPILGNFTSPLAGKLYYRLISIILKNITRV